jgi:arabinofuranosyltransferase
MIRSVSNIVLLVLLCCWCVVLAAAGLALKKPRWQVAIDVGAEGTFLFPGEARQFQTFEGFEEREQWERRTMRWMGRRGSVTFPAALRAEPLVLSLVACRCHLDGRSPPVRLRLNNEWETTLPTAAEWRRYQVLVPSTLSHPDESLFVLLQSPTWNDENGRTLSIALDRIALRQAVPQPLANPLSTLVVIVGVVGVAWWWQAATPPLLLGTAWLLMNAFYTPHALPQHLLALVLIVGLIGLWLALIPSPKKPFHHKEGETTEKQGLTAPLFPLCFSGFINTSDDNGITPPPDPHTSSPFPRPLFVLCTLLALWLVLNPQLFGHWLADDGYISFRYARNLVRGDGLVFNAGERVEGYTNFLWTLLVAGAMAMGGEPALTTSIITLVLAFVIVGLTALLARRLFSRVGFAGPWIWGGVVLLALSSPFLLYTARGSGMETALFTALILATLLALVARTWAVAGLLTALTVMTRPDGIILAGCGTLYALLAGGQGKGARGEGTEDRGQWDERWLTTRHLSFVTGRRYMGVLVALYFPYFLWRWSYYGYLLPNTFYVKVGSTWSQIERGLTYLVQFATRHLLLMTAAVGVLVVFWCWRRSGPKQARLPWREIVLVSSFAALFTLYIVVVGGDWMIGSRFFVPFIPLFALLSVWGLACLVQQYPRRKLLAIVAVLLIAGVLIVRLPRDAQKIWWTTYENRRYREVGRWLNAHTPPDTLIATGAAGILPYYADRPTIDILGLNDVYIAHLSPDAPVTGIAVTGHEKTDFDYVLGRQPAIIPKRGILDPLREHPDLLAHYHTRTFDGPEGHVITLYVRNDATIFTSQEK